ncbi:hypothetical protein K438DRAFT_1964984 [Mycena galopus ATCC 62051]|nr:hypothetical protein K438DRAFT_1964984 [Mycena galopus ATCC 62051]
MASVVRTPIKRHEPTVMAFAPSVGTGKKWVVEVDWTRHAALPARSDGFYSLTNVTICPGCVPSCTSVVPVAAECRSVLNVFLHLNIASKGTKASRLLQLRANLAVMASKDLVVLSECTGVAVWASDRASRANSLKHDSESEKAYSGDGLQPGTNNASASGSGTPANNGSDGSDDEDMPLAQRIPSAFTAQRTIRRKVREKPDQRRRRERAAREARSRPTTLHPAGAGASNPLEVVSSSSRETARQAKAGMGRVARQRSPMLPENGASQSQVITVDFLTKKLWSMQT